MYVSPSPRMDTFTDMTQESPLTAAPARRSVESQRPGTGETWRRFPASDQADVAKAVGDARDAQPAWAAIPVGQRIHILGCFHDLLFDRRGELAELISRETDKPAHEAMLTEIGVVLDNAVYLRRAIPKLLASGWFTASGPAFIRKRLRVAKEPYGVVGVITPWNYPFMLACARLLPALATGNAVVFKPSEFTPSTAEFTHALLLDAGFPPAVVQLLQGDGVTGAALAAAAVDKLFFTGSERGGRAVAHTAAERLIPCDLELGGNDPAIVLADADVGHAASGIAWGRFSNAGQTCVAPKRVFVEDAAYEPFVKAISTVVSALRTGDASAAETEVGAMIRPEFRIVLESQRDDAVSRGARVAAVGTAAGPRFFPPTVLVDVPAGARVMSEETFGPLLSIVRVKDAAEAVTRANASDYGLSASVWSRNTARATSIAEQLECGTVSVNDVLVTAGTPAIPHGGVKRSGIGRSHGEAGLAACVRTKALVADRFPSWRQPQWFGYSARRPEDVDAFIRFAHARGPFGKVRALAGVLRFVLRPGRPL